MSRLCFVGCLQVRASQELTARSEEVNQLHSRLRQVESELAACKAAHDGLAAFVSSHHGTTQLEELVRAFDSGSTASGPADGGSSLAGASDAELPEAALVDPESDGDDDDERAPSGHQRSPHGAYVPSMRRLSQPPSVDRGSGVATLFSLAGMAGDDATGIADQSPLSTGHSSSTVPARAKLSSQMLASESAHRLKSSRRSSVTQEHASFLAQQARARSPSSASSTAGLDRIGLISLEGAGSDALELDAAYHHHRHHQHQEDAGGPSPPHAAAAAATAGAPSAAPAPRSPPVAAAASTPAARVRHRQLAVVVGRSTPTRAAASPNLLPVAPLTSPPSAAARPPSSSARDGYSGAAAARRGLASVASASLGHGFA